MKAIQILLAVLMLTSVCAAQPDTSAIRIGIVTSRSGWATRFGESHLRGVQIAIDEVNTAGGINGRRIELMIEDDGSQSSESSRLAQRLIDDKVVAMIGPIASSFALGVGVECEKSGVPIVYAMATNPKVTETGRYNFRSCWEDPVQGEAMARFALDRLKLRHAAILVDDMNDYSRSLAARFERTFIAGGGRIERHGYSSGDTEFSEQLRRIRASRADALYIPGYYSEVIQIGREAEALKMKVQILGGDGWDASVLFTPETTGLTGAYITNHVDLDDPSEAMRRFAGRYQKMHGEAPDAPAVLGYDGAKLLIDAIRRAPVVDRESIRGALSIARIVDAITGPITIDSARNAVKPVAVLRVDPTKFTGVTKVTVGGGETPLEGGTSVKLKTGSGAPKKER